MLRKCFAVASILIPLLATAAQEIGFEERFAFAEDRAEALKELIPGTEDYYYYHVLHAQNRGQLEQVPALMQQWSKRHGETARYREMENRQALLNYPANHGRTLEYLRQRLGIRHDHQREQEQAPAQYPAVLDPARVSEEAFRRQALARHRDLSGFEDAGLRLMARAELTPEQRRDLLQRLPWADLDGVTALVIAELKERDSRGFGAFPIHHKLVRAQLDACRQALAGSERDLSGNEVFVAAYLARLAPSPDCDIGADNAARRAYLEAVHAFASTLPASQNELKALALYRLLDHERREGRYDAALFTAYLRLPRAMPYVREAYLARPEMAGHAARMNRSFKPAPLLASVGNDEPLVRDYLAHLLIAADDYRAYAEWLDDNYLKQVFAETKILAGVGDMERWYGLMPPAAYQALKERVDIELLPVNPLYFGACDKVALAVAVKNVAKLRVTVYDLDAFNYYREHGTEIAAGVDLDGCVPNHESVIEYKDVPPLRRHVEQISLPRIEAPGLYVVELLGNGVSSRALIRKGRLRCVERPG
ncbi:MAG: hypothetical protein PHR35_16590, partial [Kiritimatiellae bacterium]|nr:hypothetical protein [Kiritimatiellia bacterium]